MKQRSIRTALVVSLLGLSGPLRAENIVFPADAGVINVVTQYDCDPADNANDDTAKIQQAIIDHIGKHRILYFPNGVYNVNKPLLWRETWDPPAAGTGGYGGWNRLLVFQGQSRAGTVIKLRGGVFTDATRPERERSVIYTASGDDASDYDNLTGNGNQGFGNGIYNLTVSTGTGNPAAVGISFLASNWGCVRDVTVRSDDQQGRSGLSMRRDSPGPCLIKNVSVDGFNEGINVAKILYGVTMEHVSLQRQLAVGILNEDNVLSIRDLRSANNTVPVLRNTSSLGLVTLIDSTFTSPGGQNAIESEGRLYVRDLTTSGYRVPVRSRGVDLQVSDFKSDPPLSLFPAATRSLGLSIEETPTFFDTNLAHWVKVGPRSSGETSDTPAIQRAVDACTAASGKTTVYFPAGRTYSLGSSVYLRNNVRHVIGMDSTINVTSSTASFSLFINDCANTVVIERFKFEAQTNGLSARGFKQSGTSALVLKDIGGFGRVEQFYWNDDSGKLFVENVSQGPWLIAQPQRVWARQINPEGSRTLITNNGGTLWILGLKTEGTGTTIKTTGGGSTELLGAVLYPASSAGAIGNNPAFIDIDSQISLVYASTGFPPNQGDYNIHVQETRDGETRNLAKNTSGIPNATRMPSHTGRGGGSITTLYSGW